MRNLLILLAIIISSNTNATVTEGGEGMLFGENHAFKITAASGWVLDNESAVDQGIHMAFYPMNETWAESPVIMYGRSISTNQIPGIKLLVEQTVREFHGNNSPNYKYEKQDIIKLSGGKKAEIYHYSGDKWGNYEAVAYVQEKDTINFIVFNARKRESFDKYLNDFYEAVRSYQNVYMPPSEITVEDIKRLREESAQMLTKSGGKEYEIAAIKQASEKLVQAIANCATYYANNALPSFRYLVRINNDGVILESFVYPTNGFSSCFRGALSNIVYPAHQFDSFVLDVDMKMEPPSDPGVNGI